MGYDAQPFKVRPCDRSVGECDALSPKVLVSALPDPGVALDPKVDHWHVVPRGGGDNRGARDLQRWKTLVLSLVRCEHGRLQDDICYGCPGGSSPDRSGTQVGYTYTGQPVVIPPRDLHNDPEEWTRKRP